MTVSIILARLLSPSDFGAVAIINVFIVIAHVFVISGFGSALIQNKDVDNTDFSSVLYFNIAFSVLMYILFYVTAPFIANFYGLEILCPALRVLALRIPLSAIDVVQQAYVSRHMLFKKFFIATFAGTVVSAVVGITMAFMGFGVWALVIQQLVNSTISTVILWLVVKWRPALVFSLRRMKILFSYGWKLLCTGMMEVLYQEMNNLIIGKAYSPVALAYYNNGNKYVRIIITNVNDSISFVLFPAMSRFQDDVEKIKAMTRRTMKTSTYIIFPILAGLIGVARPVIELLMTEKWLPSVPFMQIACVMLAFYPVQTANMEAIKALGHSGQFLRMEIIKKIIGVAGVVIAIQFGVMAIAFSAVITMALASIINAVAVRKYIGYRFSEQLTDVLPNLVISLVMGACVFAVSFFSIHSDILLLLAQGFTGLVIYIVLSFIIKNDSFYYLKSTFTELLLRKARKSIK